MNMKICNKCGKEKELNTNNFYIRNDTKSFRNDCIDCNNKQSNDYAENNKEHLIEYRKDYYQKNKDIIAPKNKIYYQNNIDTARQYNKDYYQNNKQIISEQKKIYRKNNKTIIAKNKLEYKKRARKNNPVFRIRELISNSIYKALQNKNSSKNTKSSWTYLLYTPKDLKNHIEQLFSHSDNLTLDGKVWMTWDNQGQYDINTWDDSDPITWKWQLDHIIPHSSFNYTLITDEDFKKCWALDNLRPLSAKQNYLDRNHRTIEQITQIKNSIATFLLSKSE